MSHGFGITKQPDACNVRKVAAADFRVDPMAQQYTCSGEGMMLRKAKAAQQRAHSKSKREMEHREDGHVLECGGVPPLLPRSAIPKTSEVYREAVLKLRRPLANPPGHLIYSDPLSKSAEVGHRRRRSGRNRELAGKRWCDPTLAVRRADHAANPNRVRPGTLQQQRSPSSHQVFGDRHQLESQLRRRNVHPDSCHARRPVSVSRRHSKHREFHAWCCDNEQRNTRRFAMNYTSRC